MSSIAFQAKITLNTAVQPDPTNAPERWECGLTISDSEGVVTGLGVVVGDVVAFDTSAYEPGTFTFYDVVSIVVADYATVTVVLDYMDTNNNPGGQPPLGDYIVGQDGVISRPSENYGLLPVISRDLQGMNDKFTEYVQNYNFSKIVDNVNLIKRTNSDNVTLTRGMVVYVPETTDNMMRSHGNDTIERARAAGMVMSATPVGVLGAITGDGNVELTTDEWDVLTGGTGGLLNGKAYFLHPTIPGGISHIPPTSGFVTRVGRALSATTFDVNLEAPIQL